MAIIFYMISYTMSSPSLSKTDLTGFRRRMATVTNSKKNLPDWAIVHITTYKLRSQTS